MRVGDRVTSIRINPALAERIEKRQGEINMATIIRKSQLPVLGKGKAGAATVTVQSKGQIAFSPMASKAFEGRKFGLASWDEGSRTMEFMAFAKPPKIAGEQYKEEDMFTIGYQKKSKSAYFAGSSMLQDAKLNIGYDYKESGNQTFPVQANEKEHKVTFHLPEGKLQAKPVQVRKKKTTNLAPATEQVTVKPSDVGKIGVNTSTGAILVEE